MSALPLIRDGMIAALTNCARPAPSINIVPKPEETIADFVRFVRAHPSNPYPNIGWGLTLCDVKDSEPVSLVRRRLTNQLPIWKRQVLNRHWTANPTKVRCACLLLDLILEFEGTA